MPILTVVLVLIAVGILLWFVNNYMNQFIDPKILKLINIVVVIAVVLWILKVFGVWAYLQRVTV